MSARGGPLPRRRTSTRKSRPSSLATRAGLRGVTLRCHTPGRGRPPLPPRWGRVAAGTAGRGGSSSRAQPLPPSHPRSPSPRSPPLPLPRPESTTPRPERKWRWKRGGRRRGSRWSWRGRGTLPSEPRPPPAPAWPNSRPRLLSSHPSSWISAPSSPLSNLLPVPRARPSKQQPRRRRRRRRRRRKRRSRA